MIRQTASESHGDAKRGKTAPLYRVWYSILQRCINPKNKNFKYYGGRGIIVCNEWIESYVNFRTWANATGYAKGLFIDRENNDGGYSPENCRWVTPKVSNMNKRVSVRISQPSCSLRKYSRKGYRTGESYPMAKLRSKQVAEIKFRSARGEKMRCMGRELGIPYATIWNIVKGGHWKNIQPLDGLELFSS